MPNELSSCQNVDIVQRRCGTSSEAISDVAGARGGVVVILADSSRQPLEFPDRHGRQLPQLRPGWAPNTGTLGRTVALAPSPPRAPASAWRGT